MLQKELNELRISLCNLEREENIRILHVSECDSRAWGFHTDDSDYDLRFCYYKLPWAHTIQKQAETMRHKVWINGVPCDMQGYTLGHVLSKIGQSSFAIYEMLFSPLQLAHHDRFRPLFVAAAEQYIERTDVMNYCRGLMRKNYEFVKPFDAKHMLHSLRFALMAERIKHGKSIVLSLPELLADSGFADKAQEILRSRDDRFWLPDEQVAQYLYRMCHITDWPTDKPFVEHGEAWARDLNHILQYATKTICTEYDGMSADDLCWLDDDETAYDQFHTLIETGSMQKAVQYDN